MLQLHYNNPAIPTPIGLYSNFNYYHIFITFDKFNNLKNLFKKNYYINIGYIDQLTLRFHMTQTLRPNELGVLTAGTATNPMGIAIPPGTSNFSVMTYCMNACISTVRS
jgi:hypothetical protein